MGTGKYRHILIFCTYSVYNKEGGKVSIELWELFSKNSSIFQNEFVLPFRKPFTYKAWGWRSFIKPSTRIYYNHIILTNKKHKEVKYSECLRHLKFEIKKILNWNYCIKGWLTWQMLGLHYITANNTYDHKFIKCKYLIQIMCWDFTEDGINEVGLKERDLNYYDAEGLCLLWILPRLDYIVLIFLYMCQVLVKFSFTKKDKAPVSFSQGNASFSLCKTQDGSLHKHLSWANQL